MRDLSKLEFRGVGAFGSSYPRWLRGLRRKSGLYVIRHRRGPVLYVGSSRFALYSGITRHLARFRAQPSYQRSNVLVAVVVVDDLEELERLHARAIYQLEPRDNGGAPARLGELLLEASDELEELTP